MPRPERRYFNFNPSGKIITGVAKKGSLQRPVGEGIIAWDDIYSSIDFSRVTGTTNATMRGNTRNLVFSNGDTATLPSMEVIHSYKEGTDIQLHLHIATRGTNVSSYNVKFEFEYTWANVNAVFPLVTAGSVEFTIPGGTAEFTHINKLVTTLVGTGKNIGSQICLYIRKVAASVSDAPAANNPYILQFGYHFQMDTVGSHTVSIK